MWGLDFIKKLKPARWKYNESIPGLDDGRFHYGLIAQDVNEAADIKEFAFVSVRDGYFVVNYHEFIGPMIKAIQELSERIEELENELQKHTNRG